MQMITNHASFWLLFFFCASKFNWWSCQNIYTHSHILLKSTQEQNTTKMMKWLNSKKDTFSYCTTEESLFPTSVVLVWEEKVSHPFIFYWQVSLFTHLRGHPKLRAHKSKLIVASLRSSVMSRHWAPVKARLKEKTNRSPIVFINQTNHMAYVSLALLSDKWSD